jgi:hypothetical protein
MSLHRLTLVLNASYEPINIVSARRAMTMLCKGAAVVEVPSKHTIRTAQLSIQLPSVIRLREYRWILRRNRSVSRKSTLANIARNRCSQRRSRLTTSFRSRAAERIRGRTSWPPASPCNNRNGDRTPAEAGMALAHKPAPIGIHAKHRLIAGTAEPSWDRYMFV